MKGIIILLLIISSLLASCQDKKNITPNKKEDISYNLEGKWDLRIMGGGDILWNYEQGFELMNNSTYIPRYWNEDSSTWENRSQETTINSWELIRTNEGNRLYFYQQYSLFNKVTKDSVVYTLTSLSEDSLKISGINPEGINNEYYFIRYDK